MTMVKGERLYEFGDFRIDPVERVLLCQGELVPLTQKVFDLLLLLVENNGHIIEKDRLMKEVWPDAFVEEGNLTQNISVLRKLLSNGDESHQYIQTVPRRGYRFVGSVREFAHDDLIIEEHSRTAIVVEQSDRSDKLKLLAPLQSQLWSRRNILMAMGLVLLASIVGARLLLSRSSGETSRPPAAASIRSIAVLPFKPMSQNARDEYLELGMADSLITRLSNTGQIIVRSTSAVRKYSALDQDPIAAGRALKVESVLDGNIQKLDDRIRVTVRLVRISDGRSLWASQFDEKFTDIFAVEDSISKKVASALALKLPADDQRLLTKRYTENTEAYQLYLRGRYYWSRRTEEGLHKGIEYFQQAVERDPSYALAYAGLADSYNFLGAWGIAALPANEAYPKAKQAATTALEIDRTLVEAHTSLAFAKFYYDWNWPEAEKEFRQAIDLNPNYAPAHQWYSHYLMATGRVDESLAEAGRAEEIDPVSLPINVNLAWQLFNARHYDPAIEQLRRALDLDPSYALARLFLAMAYEEKGMFAEAIAEGQKAVEVSGHSPVMVANLARIYAASGKRTEAKKLLEELKDLSKRRNVEPLHVALIYWALDEKDQAFTWLENAYQQHSPGLALLKADPRFDSLRSDPRFQDLLRRVGLPQ